MAIKCPSCNMKYGKRLPSCPQCDQHNFEHDDFKNLFLPLDIKNELIESKKLVSSELTSEQFEKNFRDACEELKFPLQTIQVKIDDKSKNIIWTSNGPGPELPTLHDLRVGFSPRMCRSYTKEQLDAMLRHEIFHPITLKQNFQNESLFDVYAELINHREHIKKFQNDIHFNESKLKTLPEQKLGLLRLKSAIDHELKNYNKEELQKILEKFSLTILEHTIYFFHKKNINWEKFFPKYNFQKIWEYFGWINEDLCLISDNYEPKDARDYVIFAHAILLIVDLESLISKNQIKVCPTFFGRPIASFQYFFEQEWATSETDKIKIQLIDNWKNRLT